MQLISAGDANGALLTLAQAVVRDPASWDQWFCLALVAEERTGVDADDTYACALSILEMFFGEEEGRIYVCKAREGERIGAIFVICRHGDYAKLRQVGRHICGLFAVHAGLKLGSGVFHLCNDIEVFLRECNAFCPGVMEYELPGSSFDSSFKNDIPSIATPDVLVVEHDAFTCVALHSLLGAGYNLHTAHNGFEAMQFLVKNVPDIVFVDASLPDIEGTELMHAMMERQPDLPVVVLSSISTLPDMMRALLSGACGFMGKPFIIEKLHYYIHAHARPACAPEKRLA